MQADKQYSRHTKITPRKKEKLRYERYKKNTQTQTTPLEVDRYMIRKQQLLCIQHKVMMIVLSDQ